ncbi:dehydrogenase [Bordetella ansorpii]|uniref:Dehydrogenase n=1 Tax=Bordetella ansorpii TaxID=288768 RepID=A0A146AY57_9BORD|nr:hypothetical protein [Bordetella ansorpii]CZZ94245.1 dehydrogenase [Bordetella ansorpii]
METQETFTAGKRFDPATYTAARRNEIDAPALLSVLESSRKLACGVASILTLVKNHGISEDGTTAGTMIDHVQIDELLGFCIESMTLLNSRIESLADLMSIRHGAD